VEKEQIQERIKEIEAAMQQPDFWSDKNDAQALIKELHDLKAEAEGGNAYDRRGSIVSLVAGAGGDDAEDFARMLFEMYRKYFEKRGWSARILHENKNDHGGFRNMSIEVGGKNVYGTLKNEYGVHRLVRISPFNASQKRHTSFVLVEVLPVIEQVGVIELDEKDLEITKRYPTCRSAQAKSSGGAKSVPTFFIRISWSKTIAPMWRSATPRAC